MILQLYIIFECLKQLISLEDIKSEHFKENKKEIDPQPIEAFSNSEKDESLANSRISMKMHHNIVVAKQFQDYRKRNSFSFGIANNLASNPMRFLRSKRLNSRKDRSEHFIGQNGIFGCLSPKINNFQEEACNQGSQVFSR